MDRCHRIGQQKPVLVFRLATANSVEGKMLKRASEKMALERLVIKKGVFKEVVDQVGGGGGRRGGLRGGSGLERRHLGTRTHVAHSSCAMASHEHRATGCAASLRARVGASAHQAPRLLILSAAFTPASPCRARARAPAAT